MAKQSTNQTVNETVEFIRRLYDYKDPGFWPSLHTENEMIPPLLSLQFEIVSQHLVFANCIPLILKFFNQNIMSYISAKNR